MKTVKEIDQEINDLIKEVKRDSTKNEVEAIKRKVAFLRQCKLYMESEPREDFIKSEKQKIEKRIELIPSHYKDWQVGRNLTKYADPYKSYLNEMGLTNLNASLKTLNYLLD